MQHFAAAAAAVCQQGIPTFVSVINTGHLVASSGLSLRLDFDIKTWLSSSERSCLASHLAARVGMINVANHLLTPRGRAFAPWTHHPPPSRCLLSASAPPVDSLYFAKAVAQIPGGTIMHSFAVVKYENYFPARFICSKISAARPVHL